MSNAARPTDLKEAPAGSAILRAFRVLDAITERPEGVTLAELCRAVDLPKPTVFRILSTLEQDGLVAREPGQRRFLAGSRLARLAGSVLIGSPQRAARRAILDELVETVGETCNLTVPNGHEVLYLDRVETGLRPGQSLRPGSGLPLYAAATGKLFLSEMSDRARERFTRQVPRVPYTSRTLVECAALEKDLCQIRRRGYATDQEEFLPGRCCVAVAVRASDRRIVAAVSVEAAVGRTPLSELVEFLPQLTSAAEAIAGTIEV